MSHNYKPRKYCFRRVLAVILTILLALQPFSYAEVSAEEGSAGDFTAIGGQTTGNSNAFEEYSQGDLALGQGEDSASAFSAGSETGFKDGFEENSPAVEGGSSANDSMEGSVSGTEEGSESQPVEGYEEIGAG